MRSFKLGLLGFAVCFSSIGFAAKNTNLMRGGLGFLFQDHNSFENAGQFAVAKGAALQASYSRGNSFNSDQTLIPSFVYGNGRFGLGVYGSRMGVDLGNSSTAQDRVGAGVGFGLMKERLTVGAGYDRSMSSGTTDNGNLSVTATLNAPGRKGIYFGAAYLMSLNTAGRQGGKAAMGFSFQNNKSFEVVAQFNDLNNYSDYQAGGFLNLGGSDVYLSLGYQFLGLNMRHQVSGRAGVILGQLDISCFANTVLSSGSAVNYGGALRLSF